MRKVFSSQKGFWDKKYFRVKNTFLYKKNTFEPKKLIEHDINFLVFYNFKISNSLKFSGKFLTALTWLAVRSWRIFFLNNKLSKFLYFNFFSYHLLSFSQRPPGRKLHKKAAILSKSCFNFKGQQERGRALSAGDEWGTNVESCVGWKSATPAPKLSSDHT